MEKMTPPEPQSASDYDDRTTAAVKSVLIEVGRTLQTLPGTLPSGFDYEATPTSD